MKTFKLDVNGQEVEVVAAKSTDGTLWIHMNGESFTYEPPKAKVRGGKANASKISEMSAPMPGKIVKIQIEAGSSVLAGQVLVVMEAMKMEYTLKAPADAVVEKILANAGDQVSLGQLLVKMAPVIKAN